MHTQADDGTTQVVKIDRLPRPYSLSPESLRRLRHACDILQHTLAPDRQVHLKPVLNSNLSGDVKVQRWDDLGTYDLSIKACERHHISPEPFVDLFRDRTTGRWVECRQGSFRMRKADEADWSYEQTGFIFREIPPCMARALCDEHGKKGAEIPRELRDVAVPEWARVAVRTEGPGVSLSPAIEHLALSPPVTQAAESVAEATAGRAPLPVTDKPLREPPPEAFQAYRLCKVVGLDQTAAAKRLEEELGIPFDQSKVSRYVNKVARWLGAGNTLPELPAAHRKPNTMDPRKLEQGPRRDGRRPGRRDD
jgi:hypothetical protein